jgi:hypothetical protein
MTKRKTSAGTGINPKLIALVAKLDSEYARVRKMHAADDGSHEADRARETIYIKISNLGDKLAGVAATNLEEMKLKARYVNDLDWGHIQDPMAKSIVRDLLALDPKAKVHTSELEAGETA